MKYSTTNFDLIEGSDACFITKIILHISKNYLINFKEIRRKNVQKLQTGLTVIGHRLQLCNVWLTTHFICDENSLNLNL